jgi:superfamily II DNA/RNA helicase
VRKFESDPNCKVFLSSEAGGAGLNLQMADTVINFELPWNPARKNQRIGRIDRLGQTSKKLTVINLVTKQSIETKIASGLTLKQNLFDGVLNDGSMMDTVDFSASGRAHFLRQLEDMMEELTLTGSSGEEMKDLASLDDREEEVLEEFMEDKEEAPVPTIASPSTESRGSDQDKAEVMEQVMNQGMAFLSGLYKMSTGKDADFANSKVEVDKETGEVVMRFKMPKFQ